MENMVWELPRAEQARYLFVRKRNWLWLWYIETYNHLKSDSKNKRCYRMNESKILKINDWCRLKPIRLFFQFVCFFRFMLYNICPLFFFFCFFVCLFAPVFFFFFFPLPSPFLFSTTTPLPFLSPVFVLPLLGLENVRFISFFSAVMILADQ